MTEEIGTREVDLSVSRTIFGVPRSHYHADFNNFEWPSEAVRLAVLAFLQELEDGTKRNLLFTGLPGRGKTHLSIALYRWGVLRWGTAKCSFISVPEFCSSVKREFNDSSSDVFADLDDVKSLLVLDDILGKNPSAWELDNVIYRLINTSYSNGCAVVVTSNHTLSQLADILKPHEMSRLLDNATQIAFTGKDRRLGL